MQKIQTFLWFSDNAEEAVNFYVSVFNNSKIVRTTRYSEGGPGPVGSVLVMDFELEGQDFAAMNGGPGHPFTDAVSLVVNCVDQAEVDDLWAKLTAGGGEEVQCGWLKDKFGMSWQITPTLLIDMLNDPDPEKASRVMKAMMEMVKIDIAEIERAYAGG